MRRGGGRCCESARRTRCLRVTPLDAPSTDVSKPRRGFRRALVAVATLFVGAKIAVSFGACSQFRTDATWRRDIARAIDATPPALHRSRDHDAFVWTRRAVLPAPFHQASDLASTPSGLVIAASIDALGVDGAALYRLNHSLALSTVLTWTGQGFLRVHAFGDRLVVPDADAPFYPLSFAFDLDVDGYVFVSDARGALTTSAREVVPRVYHVFDTARLRDGTLVASTGAYPPRDVPYLSSRGPAALFVDAGPGHPWRRVLEYPSREARGVIRFTYLLALDDGALLAAVQSSDDGLPAVVRIEGLPASATVTAVPELTGQTLRWATFRSAIYRIASTDSSDRFTRSIDGGRHFESLAASSPQSLAASESALFLLDGGALHASTDGVHFERIAPSIDALLDVPSSLVSTPVVVHDGAVWAASMRTGEIFQAVAP